MRARTERAVANLSRAEGDAIAAMVLRLLRALRDELRREDRAPVDFGRDV